MSASASEPCLYWIERHYDEPESSWAPWAGYTTTSLDEAMREIEQARFLYSQISFRLMATDPTKAVSK